MTTSRRTARRLTPTPTLYEAIVDDDDAEPIGKRATLGERVRLLERDTRAHARSLTEIVKMVAAQADSIRPLESLLERIKAIEDSEVKRRIVEAREEERDKELYKRLDRIEESIRESTERRNGVWMKLAEMAAGPVITAIVIGVAAMVVQYAKGGGAP